MSKTVRQEHWFDRVACFFVSLQLVHKHKNPSTVVEQAQQVTTDTKGCKKKSHSTKEMVSLQH